MNKKTFTKLFAIVLMACVLFSLAIVVGSAANEAGTWTLVTDAGTLKAGDTIVIVAKDYDYALSTTQNGNNRGQASITKGSDNTLTNVPDTVQRITLEAGTTTGTFAFNVGSGYLYAASSSKNYLRTETTLSANSSWKITISDGTASVIAQGSNTRNTMQYNQSSSLFACYSSASQKAIAIYRLETAGENACEHVWDDGEVTTAAKCTEEGQKTYTCTLSCGETKTGVIEALGHTGGTATCTAKAVCEREGCGEEYGKLLNHAYDEDSICTSCGKKDPGELTISFATTEQRESQTADAQIWKNDCFVFTNNKADSATDVANYYNPVRLYKNSTITIECTENITRIVFDANTDAYATTLESVITDTTSVVEDVVTVTLDGTTNTYTITLSAAQVQLDSVTVYYETASACTHEGTETTTTTVDATCYEDGTITVTCECGWILSQEVIPAHTFANGVCSACGLVEAPKTGVPYKFGMYQGNNDGTYYITGQIVNTYYFDTTNAAADGINVYLEETEGGYYLYSFIDGVKTYINMVVSGNYVNATYGTTASTVYTIDAENNTVCSTINNAVRYFGVANSSTYNTVSTITAGGFVCQFYAAGDVAKFNSASVVLGSDLGMIFNVTVPTGVPTVTVEFADKTCELEVEALTETTYKFTFNGIAPQQMAENIKATLYVDGEAVAEIDNYSVEENLDAILAQDASLADIVNAVLAYGDAAENYKGVEGGVTAPEATEVVIGAEENKLALENAEEFGFTAAGVNFDYANRIYVKFYVEGDFKFYVDGEEVAIEKTEDGYYKYYTDDLMATQFDAEFTFEIEVDGVKATLVYSINSYAYAMQNDADMAELVKALYAYGVIASDYVG